MVHEAIRQFSALRLKGPEKTKAAFWAAYNL